MAPFKMPDLSTSGLTDPERGRGGYVRVPEDLILATDVPALGVASWALVQNLSRPGKPCVAGRQWRADKLGVSVSALDRAEGRLYSSVGGPWLGGDRHIGKKRTNRLVPLRTPARTGQSYAQVPAWTFDLLRDRVISHEEWRLYLLQLLRKDGADMLHRTYSWLAKQLNRSPETAQRWNRSLIKAGLVRITVVPGRENLFWVITDERQATDLRNNVEPVAPTPPQERGVTPPQERGVTPPQERGVHNRKTPGDRPQKVKSFFPTSQPKAAVSNARGKSPAPPSGTGEKIPTPRKPRTRKDPRTTDVQAILESYPPKLREVIAERVATDRGLMDRLARAVHGQLETRTPAQLQRRVERNWLAWDPEQARDLVAVAFDVVRSRCPDVRCEGGVIIGDGTGKSCELCEDRAAGLDRSPAVVGPLTPTPTPSMSVPEPTGPPATPERAAAGAAKCRKEIMTWGGRSYHKAISRTAQ
jgi:hypothetical protein